MEQSKGNNVLIGVLHMYSDLWWKSKAGSSLVQSKDCRTEVDIQFNTCFLLISLLSSPPLMCSATLSLKPLHVTSKPTIQS